MYRLQLAGVADNEINTSIGIFKAGFPVQPKKTLCRACMDIGLIGQGGLELGLNGRGLQGCRSLTITEDYTDGHAAL